MSSSAPGASPYFEPDALPPGFVDSSAQPAQPMPVLLAGGSPPASRSRRPRRHAVWATVALLVFPLTGVFAVAAAFAVDDAVIEGDLRRARSRSRWVLAWGAASWLCAASLFALTFFIATQVVGPVIGQAASQWAGVTGTVGAVSGVGGVLDDVLGPQPGSGSSPSGPGGSPGSVPGLGGVPIPGAESAAATQARTSLLGSVGAWEESAGVSEGRVTPARMWQDLVSSGVAPDGQLLMAHGVVGVEPSSSGTLLVSVMSGSSVCVVQVDVSGARSSVGEGSC